MTFISYYLSRLISNPLLGLLFLFQLWMFVDAIRREEWLWAILIWVFPGFTALWYFS